ncbi:MAG: NAD(P)H-hydrate dehydratase, partial [Ideonella sp.]
MDRILPAHHHRYPMYRARAARELEAAAIAAVRLDLGEPRLMVRAGAAVARLAAAVAPFAERIWIAAGPGNNGGDGIEAAIHLRAQGRSVTLTLAGDPLRLPADAAISLQNARACGIDIDMADAAPPLLKSSDLAIDALLGLGSSRPPDAAIAALVHSLNAQPCGVLAVDLPTGLDGDTGHPFGDAAVRATHTLSLLTLKPGLFTGAGRDHAGSIWLDDLGCGAPPGALDAATPDAWLSAAVAPKVRRQTAHKGSFGDVLAVGGAAGMSGAILLCARAAHAAGAGRVWVVPMDHSAPLLDPIRPELMWRRALDSFDDPSLRASTIACGCGAAASIDAVLPRLLDQAARLVIDADALNAIADTPALAQALCARREPSILTPHPLEAARLLGTDTKTVQCDRLAAAQTLADRFASVVILKGSGTVIAAPGVVAHVNSSGNAALATAGSGDVLAGWLAGV